jgi:ParB family chromosome partitioning protein
MTTISNEITLQYLDPTTLKTDQNIRASVPDQTLIDSVRDLGVLQPISATAVGDDIVVESGNRRAQAAVAAGIALVPVVLTISDTNSPNDVARLTRQYAENAHRVDLTVAEEANVFKQMALMGESVSSIAKRTKRTTHDVEAGVAAANNELASAALARYDFLTLDQSAGLAEFSDDTNAVTDLVASAQRGEGFFAHAIARHRQTRQEAQCKADAIAAWRETGGTVLEERPDWNSKIKEIGSLKHGDDSLTAESHADCPGHAVGFRVRWEDAPDTDPDNSEVDEFDEDHGDVFDDADSVDGAYVAHPTLYCTDPEAHGHSYKWGGTLPSTPGSSSGSSRGEKSPEEASAARRLVIHNNKAWRAATTVREDWITNHLATRKTLPKGAMNWLITQLVGESTYLPRLGDQDVQAAANKWLGTPGTSSYGTPNPAVKAVNNASDARATVIALTYVTAQLEQAAQRGTWRSPDKMTTRYLNQLKEWGYTLSHIEELTVSGESTTTTANDEPSSSTSD